MTDPAVTAKQLVDLARRNIEDQQRRIARQRELMANYERDDDVARLSEARRILEKMQKQLARTTAAHVAAESICLSSRWMRQVLRRSCGIPRCRDALNAPGITTPRGGRWYAPSVRNVLERARPMKCLVSASVGIVNTSDAAKVLAETHPAQVRYIKLGEGGHWEKECIEKGIVRFGFGSANAERFPLCRSGSGMISQTLSLWKAKPRVQQPG